MCSLKKNQMYYYLLELITKAAKQETDHRGVLRACWDVRLNKSETNIFKMLITKKIVLG